MNVAQDRLVRHLAIVVGLKLVVLVGLWVAFVRDEQVSVDVNQAAAHLSAPVTTHTPPAAKASALATSGDQP